MFCVVQVSVFGRYNRVRPFANRLNEYALHRFASLQNAPVLTSTKLTRIVLFRFASVTNCFVSIAPVLKLFAATPNLIRQFHNTSDTKPKTAQTTMLATP